MSSNYLFYAWTISSIFKLEVDTFSSEKYAVEASMFSVIVTDLLSIN